MLNDEAITTLPAPPPEFITRLLKQPVMKDIFHIQSLARTTACALHTTDTDSDDLCSMGDVVDLIGDYACNFPERLAAYLFAHGFRLEA